MMTDGARRLMRSLSDQTDVPDIDFENSGDLELHGGRRGAGDTFAREIGWEHAQRLPPPKPRNHHRHLLTHQCQRDRRGRTDGLNQTDEDVADLDKRISEIGDALDGGAFCARGAEVSLSRLLWATTCSMTPQIVSSRTAPRDG